MQNSELQWSFQAYIYNKSETLWKLNHTGNAKLCRQGGWDREGSSFFGYVSGDGHTSITAGVP